MDDVHRNEAPWSSAADEQPATVTDHLHALDTQEQQHQELRLAAPNSSSAHHTDEEDDFVEQRATLLTGEPPAMSSSESVVDHINAQFGPLSAPLLREMYRSGAVRLTLPELYARLLATYGELYHKLLAAMPRSELMRTIEELIATALSADFPQASSIAQLVMHHFHQRPEGCLYCLFDRKYLLDAASQIQKSFTLSNQSPSQKVPYADSSLGRSPGLRHQTGEGISPASGAKPCIDFDNGRCVRGEGCRFEHSEALRPQLVANPSAVAASDTQSGNGFPFAPQQPLHAPQLVSSQASLPHLHASAALSAHLQHHPHPSRSPNITVGGHPGQMPPAPSVQRPQPPQQPLRAYPSTPPGSMSPLPQHPIGQLGARPAFSSDPSPIFPPQGPGMLQYPSGVPRLSPGTAYPPMQPHQHYHHHHSAHQGFAPSQPQHHTHQMHLQPLPSLQSPYAGNPSVYHHHHHHHHHHHQHHHHHHHQHQHQHQQLIQPPPTQTQQAQSQPQTMMMQQQQHHQHQHQHQHQHHQFHHHHHQHHHQHHAFSAARTAGGQSPGASIPAVAPISIDPMDEEMVLNRTPSSPGGQVSLPPQDQSLSDFLAQRNLSHLSDALAQFTLRTLSALSKVDFESKLKLKVCSKSAREELWTALHPPVPESVPTEPSALQVLKEFVATNAIGTTGSPEKLDAPARSSQGGTAQGRAPEAANKPAMAVPQPRTTALKAAQRIAEMSGEPQGVRAVLWLTGTEQFKDTEVIVAAVSNYGVVVEHGFLDNPAGSRRKKNTDWMYFKLTVYAKELQSIRTIPISEGYAPALIVADLTLFNSGYIDDGRPPPPPASYAHDEKRGAKLPTQRKGRQTQAESEEALDDAGDEFYGRRGGRVGARGFSNTSRGRGRSAGDYARSESHGVYNEVCRFYRKKPEGCSRGSSCKFIHQD